MDANLKKVLTLAKKCEADGLSKSHIKRMIATKIGVGVDIVKADPDWGIGRVRGDIDDFMIKARAGAEKPGHKYTSRKKVGDKWEYEYGTNDKRHPINAEGNKEHEAYKRFMQGTQAAVRQHEEQKKRAC